MEFKYKEILNTNLSLEEILEARALMKKGHLTYAGILLFGKFPTKYLPNARVRLLKFEGNKMETGRRLNIIKEINYESAIPRIIEDIKREMHSQLRDFQYLAEDGMFKTIPEYPEFPWFEGIVNAITHRNYSLQGDCIRISLYDDHFEITSLGGIVKGLSLNDLYLGISESRNPNLANIFYRLKYVESFGTGIGRIIESYNDFDKKPVFVDTDNAFNVTLYNVNYLENNEKVLPSNLTQEEKIVEYLKKNSKINRNIVEKLLDISSTRAKNILNNMCEKELIIMIGNGKNTMYVLK